MSIEGIFRELQGQSNLNWEALEELQRAKQLYKFISLHQDENYNDYIEMLDDDTNLTSDTLSDMNTITHYFNRFRNRLMQLELTSFSKLLEFFSNDFQEAVAAEPKFM